jgi:dCMP deaminase
MDIAIATARRSNCSRRQVGAIITVNGNIVSTGYNGTPKGVTNCCDGGCPRCASDAPSFGSYDTCLCCHAEENSIVLAARHGVPTVGGTLFSTLRPCFGCLKMLIQSGIVIAVYDTEYIYPPETESIYLDLLSQVDLRLLKLPEAIALAEKTK